MRGFTASIPAGGHSEPSSTVGESAEWKKAQNTDAKNMASPGLYRTMRDLRPVILPVYSRRGETVAWGGLRPLNLSQIGRAHV